MASASCRSSAAANALRCRSAAKRPGGAPPPRALLRRAERTSGIGLRTVGAAPAVIARIQANPAWIEELERRTGAPVALQADAALAISAGHVHVRPL